MTSKRALPKTSSCFARILVDGYPRRIEFRFMVGWVRGGDNRKKLEVLRRALWLVPTYLRNKGTLLDLYLHALHELHVPPQVGSFRERNLYAKNKKY